MFRRRRSEGSETAAETLDEAGETGGTVEQTGAADGDGPAGPAGGPPDPQPVTGPYDEQPPLDGVPRLDLGSLLVPMVEGLEVRLDVMEGSEAIHAVTVATATSALQVSAFAAPRTEGIWDEVRVEIAESVQAQGGTAVEVAGQFGAELAATVPTPVPGQLAPARFFAVDGPRWFLRGVLTGAALADGPEAGLLLAIFRAMVVVRGAEAMTVREQLPLRLPREAMVVPAPAPVAGTEGGAGAGTETGEVAEPGAEGGRLSLELPERGPEITETR